MIKTKQDLKRKLKLPELTSIAEIKTTNGAVWKLAILSYKMIRKTNYIYKYVSSNKTMIGTLYLDWITGGGIKPEQSLNKSGFQFICFYEDLK